MKWLFPYIRKSNSNPDAYMMDEAIHELDYIEWISNSKVSVGDEIYLYSGRPDQFIKYKCKVIKTGKNITIQDETKYNGSRPGIKSPCFDIILVHEFMNPVPMKELIKHGLSSKRIPIMTEKSKPELFIFLKQKETVEYINTNNIEQDLNGLTGSDKEAVVKARINQSVFRDLLLRKYKKCCLCGIDNPNLLVASHIKPWSKSNKDEKVDINNGLLLCPNHDRLFDRGFISFDTKGKIIVSKSLSKENIVKLNLKEDFSIEINNENKKYFDYHRKHVFNKS